MYPPRRSMNVVAPTNVALSEPASAGVVNSSNPTKNVVSKFDQSRHGELRAGIVAAAPTVELVSATIERAVAEASRWPSMGDAARARFLRQADPAPERRVVKSLPGLA